MKQNCTDQNCERNRKYNAKTSGKSLHDRNSNIVGIDDLLIRKVVGIVQEQGTHAASSKCEDQCIAVSTHHISSDTHACFEQFFFCQRRILLIYFID